MIPFDAALYVQLVAASLRDTRTPRQLARTLVLATLGPAIVAFGSLGMLLDWLLFPRLRRTVPRTPVFVIGPSRSGNELPFKLLSRDTQFTWMQAYEMLLPSISQKRFAQWAAAIDEEYLGSFLATRLRSFEDRLASADARRRPGWLTMPEEDANLLAPTFLHAQVGRFFPYPQAIERLFYFDRLAPRRRERLMKFYARCIERHLYVHGGADSIFLSQNSSMTSALVSLRDFFPDAKFVIVMRNPLETIPNELAASARELEARKVALSAREETMRTLEERLLRDYQYPFDALTDLSSDRFALLDYEELADAPAQTIEALYERLGLSLSSEFARILQREESRPRHRHGRDRVDNEPCGPSHEEIREALPDAFECFRWSSPSVRERPAAVGADARAS